MQPAHAVIAVITVAIRGLAFAARRIARDELLPVLEVA
jgi:hypothetical protein